MLAEQLVKDQPNERKVGQTTGMDSYPIAIWAGALIGEFLLTRPAFRVSLPDSPTVLELLIIYVFQPWTQGSHPT